MIIQLSPNLFYDNFADAALGQVMPADWDLLGPNAVIPTVLADPTANGGKSLRFEDGADAMTGFAMNQAITGLPANFEVLIKLRVEAECVGLNPPSGFGGPGGRMSLTPRLVGVQVWGENRKSVVTCNFLCQLGPGNPFYEPPHSWHYTNSINVGARDGVGNDLDHIGSYFNGQVGTFRSGQTALETDDGVEAPGYVVDWNYMKLRVDALQNGQPSSRVRVKWWLAGRREPSSWRLDGEIANLYWPQNAGRIGGLFGGHATCGWRSIVDTIMISLAPDTEPTIEQTPHITSECPLAAAAVGVPYAYQLVATGLV